MTDTVPELLRRHQDALAKINEAVARGDRRETKAWRTAYKRISEQLHAAGYFEQQMREQQRGL